MSTFLIVDGNSLACRAAFAHNPKKGPDLMNSHGKLTGATYRFFTMLDKILHQTKPTHVVVGWDVGRETFRNAIDPEYKATRKKKNDDLYVQFADIKELLELIGIKNVGIVGYEGDDIVGTYVKLSEADKTCVITGDKDNFQLVTDKVSVLFPKHGFNDVDVVTPQYIIDNFEITVDKYIDLKALMGDEGDNVKGIEHCGVKTAAKLLNHYGSMEAVADNAGNIDIKGVNTKVKEAIIQWAPYSNTGKQLVTIKTDVDVPYSFDECKIDLNWENARGKFKELEFKSFISKLGGGFYGSKALW